MMFQLETLLREHGACHDAVVWAADREVDAAAWNACSRGDWLMWIAAKLGVDRRLLVLAACDCAETTFARWEALYSRDCRPYEAIRAVRAWAQGEVSIEEMRAVAAAVDGAYVTHAVAYVTHAAAYAADAAAAVVSAVSVANAYAADVIAAARLADMVRLRIPWMVVEAASTRLDIERRLAGLEAAVELLKSALEQLSHNFRRCRECGALVSSYVEKGDLIACMQCRPQGFSHDEREMEKDEDEGN